MNVFALSPGDYLLWPATLRQGAYAVLQIAYLASSEQIEAELQDEAWPGDEDAPS